MSTTIAIVGALATILMSGVSSAAVTYRLNRNKEQAFFMRKKAEELYLATDEFGKMLSGHMLTFFPLLEGSIDYNQLLDLQIADPASKKHGGAETMEMLTRIYFPEVEPCLDELMAARDAFSEIRAQHKAAYKRGAYDDGLAWKPAFGSAMVRVDRAITAMLSAIIIAAKGHAHDSPWLPKPR